MKISLCLDFAMARTLCLLLQSKFYISFYNDAPLTKDLITLSLSAEYLAQL